MVVGVWKTSDEERVTNGLSTADCGDMWTAARFVRAKLYAKRERACTRFYRGRVNAGSPRCRESGGDAVFTVTGVRENSKIIARRQTRVNSARKKWPGPFFRVGRRDDDGLTVRRGTVTAGTRGYGNTGAPVGRRAEPARVKVPWLSPCRQTRVRAQLHHGRCESVRRPCRGTGPPGTLARPAGSLGEPYSRPALAKNTRK